MLESRLHPRSAVGACALLLALAVALAVVASPALAASAARDTTKHGVHVAKKKHAARAAAKPAATVAAPTAAASGAAAATRGVPSIPDTREPLEVKLATVKALHDNHGAMFVDARTADEYARGHIAGAISLPFDDVFKMPELAKQFDDNGQPIVTYCDGGDCTLSKDLAFSLIDAGHRKVAYFTDGYPGWKNAGYAVSTGAKP